MLRMWMGPFRLILCIMGMISLVYCVGLSVVAYVCFYYQSQGNLIYREHKIIGSQLLGQEFSQDKYFWPRSSLTHYQNDLIEARVILEKNRQFWSRQSGNPPSASQVDPDISVENAYAQIERVAKARQMPLNQVIQYIKACTTNSFFGYGQAGVNVFLLNLSLDEQKDVCHGQA